MKVKTTDCKRIYLNVRAGLLGCSDYGQLETLKKYVSACDWFSSETVFRLETPLKNNRSKERKSDSERETKELSRHFKCNVDDEQVVSGVVTPMRPLHIDLPLPALVLKQFWVTEVVPDDRLSTGWWGWGRDLLGHPAPRSTQQSAHPGCLSVYLLCIRDDLGLTSPAKLLVPRAWGRAHITKTPPEFPWTPVLGIQ